MRATPDPPTVLNHLGGDATDRIVAAVPRTRVAAVPVDGPDREPLPSGHGGVDRVAGC